MKRASIAIALLLCGFLAGLVLTGRLRSAEESVAQPAQRSAATTAASPVPAGFPDFTGVAAQSVKGVANISSTQVVSRPNSPFATDPFFEYFFGGRDDVFGSREQLERSLGSGVLISADGYVVTNSHVIGSRNAEITVAFEDRHEVPAQIIGIDPTTDLALVKVARTTTQTPVRWGDSSKVRVGEWVLAIGSPYQLSQTVTFGIVSALGRTNLGFSEYEDFIQTDAAINQGNSGGALVNGRGELIGINTGILSQSGGYQGIGFAIPSNLARRVIDELIRHGEVRRGTMGRFLLRPLTTQLASRVGLREARGAFVDRMDPRSPAYQAGLQYGDVITSFNGQTVNDPQHLGRLIADAPIGSTAKVGVVRDGRQLTLQIPIVQRRG